MIPAMLLSELTWQSIALAIGVIFLVTNLKGIPGFWHLRLIYCLQQHIIFNRNRRVDIVTHGAQSLFYPVVTTSRNWLIECDYNMHKSNATYFTDLDINRVHLIASLFKDQMALGFSGGDLNIALGSTACVFRREIKPYEAYEIHTRVLCWDEKWLYLVSHFLKTKKGSPIAKGSASSEAINKSIAASAITRYVFKRGRVTVSPETVLSAAKLLPPRETPTESIEGSPTSTWTWDLIEAERQRGLQIAKSFLALDALHGTLNSNDGFGLGLF
ncbi:conserved hypothetical protein [Talaromyces stipitatus ATCC 10500]|uniref:Capsule polysaccharide biosynthesis protein n=1 Tax=Talaromyces stipitatus (strain ATCC 10500 / CBS 375.48 / QM 6759 / NRRL 1006) TaxID=441959 RepID=B8LZT9_TALSN|nr:uncharacterized protein TSTA_081040 [Talaromyces stipitatus ATCC 10500]EED20871.1 conserved hypothetical protein [Talaromyces stipitatus ATCC 10500]